VAIQREVLARNGDIVVQRRRGLSVEAFVAEHLEPGIPVVLADATQQWPALAQFTPEYFRNRYADATVEVGKYGSLEDSHMRLGDFLDLLATATTEKPAPYPCKLQIDGSDVQLADAIEPAMAIRRFDYSDHWLVPKRFRFGARSEVFFGSPGGLFPYLHIDYMGLHALISQVYGEKEFVAIPPSQADCVYPDPDNPWVSAIANHHTPDLSRYPAYARATPVTFRIGPGDTLFIPNGWWHSARSVTTTISVAQDLLGLNNWPRFQTEIERMYQGGLKSRLAGSYLSVARRLLPLLPG